MTAVPAPADRSARVYWVRRTLVLVCRARPGLRHRAAARQRQHGRDRPGQHGRWERRTRPRARRLRPRRATPVRLADGGRPDAGGRGSRRRAAKNGKRKKAKPKPLAAADRPLRPREVVVTPSSRRRPTPARRGGSGSSSPPGDAGLHLDGLARDPGRQADLGDGPDLVQPGLPAARPQADRRGRRKDVPAKVDVGWRGQRSDTDCSRTTGLGPAGLLLRRRRRRTAPSRPTCSSSSSRRRSRTRTAKPKPRTTRRRAAKTGRAGRQDADERSRAGEAQT